MAPNQKITREMILEHALEITRLHGIETVNSRNVAKSLNCSTQPIFTWFSSMEALRQATFEYACGKWGKEILSFKEKSDFLARASLWVIDLARNESNFFHLLYLSDNYKNKNLMDFMMNFESNRELIINMQKKYDLNEVSCKDILLRSFLFLHGIATMIATNHMEFTNDQVAALVKQTLFDMVQGAKKGVQL